MAADINYEKATARIRFDPAKTSIDKLIFAIAQLGSVAKLKDGKS